MSSNSSVETIGRMLVRSFARIEQDNPDAFRDLIDVAGDLEVGLEVGEEQLAVVFSDGTVRVRAGLIPEANAFVSTDRSTIDAVLSGSVSLVDAILDDRLVARGPLDVLIRLHDGLQAYVRAAVGTPRHRQGVVA